MKNYSAAHRFFTNLCFLIFCIIALQIQSLAAGGDLDTTFTAGVTTFGSTASVVEVQADGRVLVGGNFRVVNGRSYSGLVRLNANGTIDQSFNIGTGFNTERRSIIWCGSTRTARSTQALIWAARVSSIKTVLLTPSLCNRTDRF